MSTEERYLTFEDVAARLRMTPSAVRKIYLKNHWPHIRISAKTIRFSEDDMAVIKARHRVTPTPEGETGLPGQTARSRGRRAS